MNHLESVTYCSVDELQLAAASWDDLWLRSDVCSPTARAEPLAAWLKHLSPKSSFRAVGVRSNGQLVAMLPLMARPLAKGLEVVGLPVDCSVATGDLLLDPNCDTDAVLDRLVGDLSRLPWPLVWLDGIPYEQPRWQSLIRAAERRGLPVDIREQHRVAQVDVTDDWDAYFASCKAKHRENRRSEARRIERAGGVELRIIDDANPDETESLLRKGFSIEQRSWKSSAGTSVLQDERMFDYYCEVARVLARLGHLRLMYLVHDGRWIAFSFGWRAKGVTYGVKIGCDEQFRKFAPGHLMMMQALQESFKTGDAKSVDFVGPAAAWHLGWATGTYAAGRVVFALPSWHSKALFYLYTTWQPRLRRLATRLSLA